MVDIYMVGVGGQGIITASRIIGDAAVLAKKNILLSETHGMAQRGGSVVCTARIGDVHSPLIPPGKIDVILSFELLETMRALCLATKDTSVITSTERVMPLSVSQQKMHYPTLDEVREAVLRLAKNLVPLDATQLARDAGSQMSSNVVMVGALAGSNVTGIERHHYEEAIELNVPAKLQENLAAFEMGLKASTKSRP